MDASSFPSQGEAWVSPATAAASSVGPCTPGPHPSGSLSALASVTARTRPGPWGPSSRPCSPGKGEEGSGPACTRAGGGEGAGTGSALGTWPGAWAGPAPVRAGSSGLHRLCLRRSHSGEVGGPAGQRAGPGLLLPGRGTQAGQDEGECRLSRVLPGALLPAQVFGQTSSSGSPGPGWAVAAALLGEGDSGDLGQRPGQASPGEQEAWRETQTPPAAATHTSGHAPGPRYPQLTTSELYTSSVPGPRHSPPPTVIHPVMSVTCKGTWEAQGSSSCFRLPPRAAPNHPHAQDVRSGQDAERRAQPPAASAAWT